MGRLENVDLINERRVHLGDAETNLREGNQRGVKNLPPLGGKLFGIVDLSQGFGQAAPNPIAGNTTAAATTGPASGPRPASSTPAMRVRPRRKSSDSKRKSGGLDARAGTGATFGRNGACAQPFSSGLLLRRRTLMYWNPSGSLRFAKTLPRMDTDGHGWKGALYPCLSA